MVLRGPLDEEMILNYPDGPYMTSHVSSQEKGRGKLDKHTKEWQCEDRAEIGVMWPQAQKCCLQRQKSQETDDIVEPLGGVEVGDMILLTP